MTHPLPAVSQFVFGQPVTRVDGQRSDKSGSARRTFDLLNLHKINCQ